MKIKLNSICECGGVFHAFKYKYEDVTGVVCLKCKQQYLYLMIEHNFYIETYKKYGFVTINDK